VNRCQVLDAGGDKEDAALSKKNVASQTSGGQRAGPRGFPQPRLVSQRTKEQTRTWGNRAGWYATPSPRHILLHGDLFIWMKHSLPNPTANRLGAGVTEADVLQAVTKSGYPLQTIVADYFRNRDFRVIEEWAYIDKETEHLRTIDVKSEKPLYDYLKEKRDLRVRPALVLLVECKQSQLPYIFFLSPRPIRVSRFPLFAGLRHREIAIKTDDDRSTFNVNILGALGLESHPFIFEHPEFCSSFSKCVRKGGGVRAFRQRVLPEPRITPD